MNTNPLVSVVIPVYNRPHVVETIKSICRQTYQNLEILVIDNDSTDDTQQQVLSINDTRVKLYVNEKNMGQTFSINRGLELANGKYIARIDSDDIALPTRIQKQVEFMEKNPDYVLCGSFVKFISDDDKELFVVKMPTTYKGIEFMHTIACGMYHPAAMYRKSIIDQFGIRYDPNIKMAEDYDLWIKLMRHGKALNLPEILVLYRRGNNNDSQKYRSLMEKESTEIRKRYCQEVNYEEKERKKVLELISLEHQKDLKIFTVVKITKKYIDYLNRHIERDEEDYRIVKQHIFLKIYGSCISENKRIYAIILKKLYCFLKKHKK